MSYRLFLAPVVMATVFTGCGFSEIVPVRGRVTYTDGTPLSIGQIAVETPSQKTTTWAVIRLDGTFSLGTLSHNDGCPRGSWRVAIHNSFHEKSGAPLIHERFMDFETSGLTFTVPDQTDWQIVVEKPSATK